MNFFERQRAARADSRRLVVLFGLAVALIVAAVSAITLFLLRMSDAQQGVRTGTVDLILLNLDALGIVAAVTLAVIAAASLVRTVQLRQGGASIATSLGGTEIPAQSRDPQHQRLRNVVEEVAIASGVPVPQIFVLERESGINAFAAGFSTADAAIAVTRGALDCLSRDELQGVIAHEFSHVLNGDMRLNLRLIGWLAGITLLSLLGRILMRVRGRNAGGVVLFGVALFVIGSIGLLCARMIKAGISRKREYLADASAVQFTRQTDGIAGALKKIAANAHGSKLEAADAEEASHLLFGDGVGYSRLFATHPPLEQRIRALEPSFKLTDLTAWMRDQRRRDSEAARSARRAPLPDIEYASAGGNGLPAGIAGLAGVAATALQPDDIVGQVGNPGDLDYRTADLLQHYMPSDLDEAAHDPDGAPHVLAALLLAGTGEVRERQLADVCRALGDQAGGKVAGYAAAARSLHPMQRLPLASIAFAALRRLPRERIEATRDLVQALVAADGRVSLFEYCLAYLLRQQIAEALAPERVRAAGRHSLKHAEAAVGALLSILANEGHAGRAHAERAFAAGVVELGPGVTPRFAVPQDWTDTLDDTLAELDRLAPMAKSLLIAAMSRTIMHDGCIDVAEAELLRTVCAALHCPLPPLLHEQAGEAVGTIAFERP
jgi:Zn-dependent protease with chaperone function